MGGRRWKLLAPLAFYSKRLGRVIIVPAGFVTDFASVPRLPFMYWFFGGKADRAAVVHDLLYRWGEPLGISRWEADMIFLEAMEAMGMSFTVRYPMTWGVVIGGWWSYGNLPGCLDHRGCPLKRKGKGPECLDCVEYKNGWSKSIITLEEYYEHFVPSLYSAGA